MTAPLRVCVEARLPNAIAGGIQQVLIGLAAGLSALSDSNEEYHFVVNEHEGDWLKPYVNGPCRFATVPAPAPAATGNLREIIKALTPEPVRRLIRRSRSALRSIREIPIPASDGTVERLGGDVVHFPVQRAYATPIPSIYHPHDLQHRHHPEYFQAEALRERDALYRAFCERAALVAVTSSWVKDDLVSQYGLLPEKIGVVPLAPVLDSYPTPTAPDLEGTRAKLRLPDRFVFYPAQTWPHKNHIGLLRAVARLRAEHPTDYIHVVCSGLKNSFYGEIERVIRDLKLEDCASFVGFVTPVELQCLYRMAACVVIPSKFEAASFPLWEAFLANVPAACSRVTSLPRQAGDAALLFDPDDPQDMASAIRRLWTDPDLCRQLTDSGRNLVRGFTWDQTARHFRAHYRKLAARQLSDEDRAILEAPPRL
jgi:glycosyltransferase involved in cell wall biosynthesis